MTIKLAWDWVVLRPLADGKPKHLKGIYAFIDEEVREFGGIDVKLFKVSGRWGPRKDFTHVVRGIMSSLKKRGMVKHLRTGKGYTGMYQITDAGLRRLGEVEP